MQSMDRTSEAPTTVYDLKDGDSVYEYIGNMDYDEMEEFFADSDPAEWI